MKKKIVIGLIGDLFVTREDPASAFAEVADVLKAPDVLFGNLEGAYSDAAETPRGALTTLNAKSSHVDVFADAGFDVMSMANNHIVDSGAKVMLDNRARLHERGVAPCGVGENLAAAREPAILERNGVTIAFLAYASVFPIGYEATETVAGLAPCRSYDHWRPAVDSYYVPGAAPVSLAVPHEVDFANLADDIARAKEKADLVFASFHWGDFLRPFHLTDHERKTARLCVDHGVDMVIGHHHHAIRGVEWYRDKPIFYGLGHFVFELPFGPVDPKRKAHPSDYSVFAREGWPLLPLHPDTRMTVVGIAEVEAGRIAHVGVLPCRLRPDGGVFAVDIDSAEGGEVLDYLETCNSSQDLNGRIVRRGAPRIAGFRTVRIAPGAADGPAAVA